MKVDVKTIEKLMKGFNESARSDAMKAIKKDRDLGIRNDDEDEKQPSAADVSKAAVGTKDAAGSKNIIAQLRKVVSLRGKFKVEFGDKKKQEVPVRIAQEVQKKYNSFRRPADKEKFQTKIAKSYKDMTDALKENTIKEKTSQDRIVGLVSDKLKEKKHG